MERSRTFWKRLLLFAFGAAICVIVYLFLLNFPGLTRRSSSAGVIPVVVLAASTWWLTTRFLKADRMSAADLGLSSADDRLARLAVGFVAGSGLTLVWLGIVTVIAGASWHVNPNFSVMALVGVCAFAFFNNVSEELVYRGYAFVKVASRFGPYVAILATSSIFALLHLQGGVPLLSVVAGVLTSGLVFGAIFARWRSLPLALGFHVATNIVQDASGLRMSAASVLAPAFPATTPVAGASILIAIALVNVLLAVGILIRRAAPHQHPETGVVTSNEAASSSSG